MVAAASFPSMVTVACCVPLSVAPVTEVTSTTMVSGSSMAESSTPVRVNCPEPLPAAMVIEPELVF